VLGRKQYDKVTGKVLSLAFLRRPPKPDGTPNDQKGLSVNLNCETADILRKFDVVHAIGKLIVEEIRAIPTTPNLDVIQNSPTHANITGLPAHGENETEAEHLARQLAKICTVVYPSPSS
jgi:hypothetical protein